jgi:ABC-type branched-subunit amino acid transport system substrate-binding protein
MKGGILTCALAATLAGVAFAGAASAADITIGIIGPLSGPAANSGISMRQAYEAAAAQVNKDGGIEIGGEKSEIKLIFEDSASRPTAMVTTRRAIAK